MTIRCIVNGFCIIISHKLSLSKKSNQEIFPFNVLNLESEVCVSCDIAVSLWDVAHSVALFATFYRRRVERCRQRIWKDVVRSATTTTSSRQEKIH